MARPNFADALRQRNMGTPEGNPTSGAGAVPQVGVNFATGEIGERRPNFALALEQNMPADGVMADTPQFQEPGSLRLGQVFGERLKQGTDQTQQLGGALLQMLGAEFGSSTIETFGKNIVDRNQEEIEAYMPSVHSIGEIEDVDDFLEWAVGGFGQAIPSLATALAGGGVGGVVGRQVIKRRIANELTDRTLGGMAAAGFARDVAEGAASRTLRNPATARILRDAIRFGDARDIRRGMMRGAGLGTFIPSTGMMTGEAHQAGITNLGTALAVGATGGLLETAVLGRFVNRMFPGVDKAVSHNFIKDFAKATGSQAVLEGSQEGAQQVIQLAGLAYHDPSFDLMDPENAMQVADAFAIGSLVGSVMGAGSSAVGQTTTALRQGIRGSADTGNSGVDPFTIPPLGPRGGPDSGLPADFEPADNTVTEEIAGRINTIMDAHVTPAMNTIQRQVGSIVDKVTRELPGVRSVFGAVLEPVRQLNDEFIAGQTTVVEEVRRYAGEQVAYIVEAAEEIADPQQRAEFIEDELAAVEEEISGVAEEIAARGEQVAETAANRVSEMQMGEIKDTGLFMSEGADPEFTFGQNETLTTQQGVKFQRPTRGDRAVPIKTRKSAENRLKQLREAYPSATEDSFQIIDAPNGDGFLIVLADQLQRESLIEDEIVTAGVQNARTSARGNPDKSRQVKLENKTIIDVPTIAYQGKRLDTGEGQTLAEAFAAITGRMLDRGTITDGDFINMMRVFEGHFSNDEQASNVRMIEERHAAIDRGDFTPPKKPKKVRGQRKATEASKDLESLPIPLQKQINEEIDQQLDDEALRTGGVNIGYQEAQVVLEEEAMTEQEMINLHNDQQVISSVQNDANGFVFKTARRKNKNPGRPIRRQELLEERLEELVGTEQEEVNDESDRQPEPPKGLQTEDQQRQRATREATGRNPTERDIPQQPKTSPRITQIEQQNAEIRDSINRKQMEVDNILGEIEYWEQLDAESDLPTTDRSVLENHRSRLAEVEAAIADDVKAIELNNAQIEKIETRKPRKKGDKKPATPRQIVQAKQRARLEREEQRDKEAKAKRKPRRKPTMRTPNKKVSTRKPGKSAKSRAVVWLPGMKGQQSLQNAATELVEKALNLIPESKTELRVVNKEAIRQMIDRNHPDSDIVAELGQRSVAAILATPGRPTYIMVPDNATIAGIRGDRTELDPGIFLNALVHELGHHIHFETWASTSKEGQDALLKAFREDVKSGKFRTTEPGRGKGGYDRNGVPFPMNDNSHEFREWMADQFVDWMMNRRAPRNALERFLETVAKRVQALWDFVRLQPDRYGMLNETYADFIDTLAKRMRDSTSGSDFWFKEGSIQRGVDSLFGPPGQPVEMNLSPQQIEKLKTSLEEYPKIARSANRMIDWMRAAWYTAIAPSTSRMRDMTKKGITAADELVRMFNRQPHGQSKVGRQIKQNYHQAREQMQGVFMEKMRKILQGASEAEMFRLGQELRAMDGNPDMVPTTLRGKAIRKLLDEMHDYALESGLPVGKIDNYFPRMFNREKLINDEEAIIAYLIKVEEAQMHPAERAADRAATEQRARRTYNSLISQEADAAAALRELERDPLATQAPAGGFMRSRTATDKFFSEYYLNDVEAVISNYVNTVTKRAEYNRLLGQKAFPNQQGGDAIPRSQWDPKKRLKEILADARAQGATEDELQYMKKYVEANIGMYGRDDIPEGARKVLATVVAYQNMRTLLFAVFASLPDAMGPAIRSGSTRATFKTLFNNINDIRRSDGAAADMARTWGIISDAYNHHVLSEYVDNHYMPKGIRKWNDRFFKYTGLNWWTDFTRKAALSVGVDSIQNEALKAQTAPTQQERDRALQFLGELGLTPTDVNRWIARGKPTWGSMTYTETNETNIKSDRAVANALVQFVDEAILRPNPSQRPVLASHPAMMLFYHLKGFMYAIHDTILKRLIHNFKIAKTPARIAAVFIPAIGMMLMTAVGLELRELVAGTEYTDRMDGWEYTWEVFERTGLPGLTQFAWDWDSASARGQSELAGLTGPAMGQVGDLLSKPTSQTIPKSIPVVAQLPWARDFLREATPL